MQRMFMQKVLCLKGNTVTHLAHTPFASIYCAMLLQAVQQVNKLT